MSIRTDMAVELRENISPDTEGIVSEETSEGEIRITRINVINEKGALALGKPVGKYITLDMKSIGLMTAEERRSAADTVAGELKALLGEPGSALVTGLGNRAVTPDSLGPKTCDGVFVTRHIKKHIPEAIDERAATVCALAPGVLGVTGLESYEVIKGVLSRVSADVLVAVDALSARSLSRIGLSVQISDTGISPGSGVSNAREGLYESTMGIKVVAIGVPTVVYASTIVSDILDEAMGRIDPELKEKLTERVNGAKDAELVVAPKDIDVLTESAASLIADALNIALNPHISREEIADYM